MAMTVEESAVEILYATIGRLRATGTSTPLTATEAAVRGRNHPDFLFAHASWSRTFAANFASTLTVSEREHLLLHAIAEIRGTT